MLVLRPGPGRQNFTDRQAFREPNNQEPVHPWGVSAGCPVPWVGVKGEDRAVSAIQGDSAVTIRIAAPARRPTTLWAQAKGLPLLGAVAAAAVCTLGQPAAGAGLADLFRADPNQATSSRQAREEAVAALPVEKLDESSRAKTSAVLSSVTAFRRMPTQVIPCDPELYLFCVQHPDVVVNIWEVLGVTQMKLRQTGENTYAMEDGVGTKCTLYYLHCSSDTHLLYAEGVYDGPLFSKKVHGRGLMLLRTGYAREPDGRHFVTARLDTFLQLEPGALEVFTKTLQPLVGKVADGNFVQTAGFLGSLSKTADVNARGLQRLATKLEGVQPEVRQAFAEVAARASQRSAAPRAAAPQPTPKVATRPNESVPR